MKIYCCLVVFLPQVNYAQQNNFEVPTSELVEKNTLFFQQQFSFESEKIHGESTFTWGLLRNFEIGFGLNRSSYQLPATDYTTPNEARETTEPNLLINLQKGFALDNQRVIGLGSKSGIRLTSGQRQHPFAGFHYLNFRFQGRYTQNALVLGIYFTNRAYAGEGNPLGLMCALQLDLIKKKLSLVADYISGSNDLASVNGGLQLNISSHWSLAMGYRRYNAIQFKEQGVLFQICRK